MLSFVIIGMVKTIASGIGRQYREDKEFTGTCM